MKMNGKIKKILGEELDLIKLSQERDEEIKKISLGFVSDIKKKISLKKTKAQVFVGGSLAKGTVINKKIQDIDVFIRFDKRYKDSEISEMLGKLLKGAGEVKRVHGSRDYFQINKNGVVFEVVPVVKISRPEQARNVTDLSYFHVNYVKGKIRKKKKLGDEIRLAKTFCHAQRCYGAESYVGGFSGYALELLIIYYGSFLKFIKEIVKMKEKKIIDPARFYKSKRQVLWDINESKLDSPIIFVDPTFKERNALAALSDETFAKFREICKKFLRAPSRSFFEVQDIEDGLRKKHKELILIEAKTKKQKGDIAGSKLRKFYDFLSHKLGKYFEIKFREFEYDEEKNVGKFYFVLKKKLSLFVQGPKITDVENLTRFKKKHKNAKIKNKRAYVIEKNEINIEKFVKSIDRKILREMDICGLELRD